LKIKSEFRISKSETNSKSYPKIFEISSLNLLPLRWGRKKVGVDKRNLFPPPLHPLPPGEGKFLGAHFENVRRKFSD
jgi:hypothetical protein